MKLLLLALIARSNAFHFPIAPLVSTPLARHCGRALPRALHSSFDEEDVVTEAEIVPIATSDSNAFVVGQSKGYRTCSFLSAALAVDTYKRRALLGASAGNVLLPPAGSILAAIIFWRLRDATENARLHSETYKTLNIGIALYSTFTLAAYLVSFPFLGASGAAVHVYNIVIAAYGWVVGCQGINYTADMSSEKIEPSLLVQSFASMIKNAATSMTSNFDKLDKTFPYLITFLLCQVGVVHDLAMLKAKGLGSSSFVSMKLFSLGRFIIVGKSALVLKSAGDRGRLQGTTFRALSAGLAVALAATVVPAVEGGKKVVGVVGGVLAVASALNAQKKTEDV